MAFDIQHWKEALKQKLPGFRERMARAGVNSVYAMLSATALWPVVEASQRGDYAGLMAVGGVLGGIGVNLVSNQIQAWSDEADAARKLEAQAAQDAELRAALDKILEALEAPQLAEQTLAETDRAWFAETLNRELAQFNSTVHNEAHLEGSGAIAQGDGAVAVGSAGVYVGGNATGDINTHQVQAQTYVENQIVNPPPPDPAAEKRSKARTAYLARLRRHCQSLPLAALGGEDGGDSEITLDTVYIDLDTTTQKEKEEKETSGKRSREEDALSRFMAREETPLSALEAACAEKRMALLGDPGAGKSTFVKKLLGWQAAACLGQAQPPEGLSPSLLPVLVILRDLAPRLTDIDLRGLPAEKRDQKLREVVTGYILQDLCKECPGFEEELLDSLQSGGCLLVLDGLDEVPQAARGHVRLAVEALITGYELQRVIVTCRVRSYVGEAVLPNFTSRTLAPFTQKQIVNFVQAWYKAQQDLGHLTAELAQARAGDLAKSAAEEDLRELSSNPMLLTTMAIIHQREVGLPRERVRLYNMAVDVLLRRWQKHKVGDDALAEFLKDDLKLRAVMESLAYAAHRASAQSGGNGSLLRKDVIDLLEQPEHLGDLRLAGEFLDYVDQRVGLLVGAGGELNKPTSYSFPHRTFQEYLAGSWLAGRRDRSRTFLIHAAEGDSWDLAAQLAFEELYYNRRAPDLLDLAYTLGGEFRAGEQHERAFLWAGQITALVGRAAVEKDNVPIGGAPFLEKLLPGLVKLLDGSLLPLERAEAGRALGKLGDPRPEVLRVEDMQFGYVPEGKFWMGSKEGEGYEDERPQHELALPAYWLGRYPVTNAQYNEFVAAGGYEKRAYWPEAVEAEVWKKGKVKAWNEDEFRQSPANFGEPFNLPNHPVVGITWYEMLAFTRWLDETWRGKGYLPESWLVGLPSEAQWEKAARGGLSIPTQALICPISRLVPPSQLPQRPNPQPRRAYPWGEEFPTGIANTVEAGLRTTSTLGCFPGNLSPYGLSDMSGNVWEWTTSPNADYPYPEIPAEQAKRENLAADSNAGRILRGGSFVNLAVNARCAYRLGSNPGLGDDLDGFRVVICSPFFSP